MASNVVFNNVTYSIPADGDTGWGPDLTAYFISIASNAFQKTGGAFTLTAEANFGATYGLKSAYIKSQASNPASSGVIRLGSTQSVSWRNNANNADLALTTDASDNLLYNSKTVLFSGLGLIVNADVSNSAAIAYSKLNLATSIVNADVSASAAIDYSKLAALTIDRVLVSNGTGAVSAASVTATTLSYLDATSSIQTQLNAKAPSASPTFSGIVTLPATVTGAAAQVLTLPTSTSTLATLGLTETFTGAKTFNDNGFTLQDNSDNTKKAVFELSGITTGTTRTITVADANITIGKAPTIQRFTSGSGTYTTPAGVRYIQVEMVGGGGGGGGSGSSGSTSGGNGGNSTFGTSLLTANGGALGSSAGGSSGAGGSATVNSPAIVLYSSEGQSGSSAGWSADENGGDGGNTPFAGRGRGGRRGVAGEAAKTNSGSGGGGGGGFTGIAGSGSGGAGAYIRAMITGPDASYSYAIGGAGTAGGAGTSGYAGGAGAAGVIIVTEYYN